MFKDGKWMGVVVLLAVCMGARGGMWDETVLSDDFSSDPSSNWTYSGQQNGSSQNLFRWNASGYVDAEWDQSNLYTASSNPSTTPDTIAPSYYARSLGQTLTDDQRFRFGATLDLSSVANTTEFYQVANFGLYGLSDMGADRTMSDNFSGNSTLVKDGSDFVEFNYFINNDSFGWNANTGAAMGAHITGDTGDYTTGASSDAMYHKTDMGKDNWLPTGTDLYVEVTYYGTTTRRAHMGVYTDAAHTTLLSVNGVEQYYWTQPLPADDHFTLTDIALFNYTGVNWGGTNGTAAGMFDDVYVQTPEPVSMATLLIGGAGLLAARRRRRAMR